MALVCSRTIESLVHASVIHEELRLGNDALVDEIVCMILGYLDRSGVEIQPQ